MRSIHVPVLLHETVAELAKAPALSRSKETPWYLDATLGGAGHALAIAGALSGKLNILGFDRDIQAVERGGALLEGKAEKVVLECGSFRDLDKAMDAHRIREAAIMLFDLGISSDELDLSGRGFSFLREEPLQMTMGDPAQYPFTAATIVNSWEESTLADVIFAYGEERYARRIAKAIVAYRLKKPIETSDELAELIKMSVPASYRRSKIHPATKTFQALRITVNDELAALKEGLAKGYDRLAPGGRMAVISFHSLEDRIAKQFMRERSKADGAVTSKKPVIAGREEIAVNPRSRSAKLRILEKAVEDTEER